ncbi:hypothetical protein DRF65_24115 [Chryseobacterium pennae]|uniref:Uncharacterized protein n=1 Tax=Chryseobacterium pennae TaxID=2258962 RepID=A0A3D9C2N7_9FLAO|nr:hypothetical protein [Chryseobacterium pennae]REC59816.1 hypothetical protein DRF65_24115 [Chryseobacterium pennae]
MHLEKGKVYIVNDHDFKKSEHLKSDLKKHFGKYIFLNFPDENSLKVYSYYEKVKNRTIEEVKREISCIIEEDFELEDAEYSEKVMTVSYLLLQENTALVVHTAGMSWHSIDCFKDRFMKVTAFLDRILIIYNNK